MAISIMGNSPQTTCIHKCSDQTSVLNSINTGFGPENSLELRLNGYCGCGSKTTLLHLYKETYLSEFQTEDEKKQVRLNLGVPSVQDVQKQIALNLADYATKQEVDRIIAGTLDLTNYYTKPEIDEKLGTLKLSLDRTPTKGSMNGVTSDGVWQHVDDTVGAIHRYTNTI